MISYPVYKILHFLGIFLAMVALAGMSVHAANGGARAGNVARKLLAAMHGTGGLLILVAGFGLLARLGVMHEGLPGWVWAKLVIWVIVIGTIAIPYRRPSLALPALIALPILGGLGAYFALYKPF